MRRTLFCALALMIGAWAAPGALAQPNSTFTFGFTGPDFIEGAEGAVVGGAYNCTLTHAGDPPGAQGWSMAVTADGAGAAITDITYAGTNAAVAESGGFASVELTTGAGNEGAVEAIVLSFKKPITFPVGGTDNMAIIQVGGATIPPGGGSFKLLYKDNLKGSGEPVPNNVTQGGETRVPVLAEKVVALRVIKPPCTLFPINVGFSGARVSSAVPWEGVAGTDGAGGEIVLKSALGTADPKQAVFAAVISQATDFGIQGWSLSVGSMKRSEGTIVSATYAGTIAAQAETGGFASVELINPALPENVPLDVNSGAVEAIVLSFKKPITLPLTGVESVMAMEVAAAGPQTDADQVVTLKYVSGLKGSGEPVPNNFTVNGETEEACNTDQADVKVVFKKQDRFPLFIRGNPNNDGKVDIADPIYIINALFRSGPEIVCEEAADMNGDAMMDASDAVYLIAYLFSAGPAPSAPFPDCGQAADDTNCPVDQNACK